MRRHPQTAEARFQTPPPTHTHTHTHTSKSQVSKKVPPRRGTGHRRCVETNPHKHTSTTTGSRASDEDERNTHAPTKPRNASTYIRVCGSSIKQKLKVEKLVTTSEKKQPAGHGPVKSIKKFERKFCRGDASKLNKKNGESPNSQSVSPSSQRPATRKNGVILNENFDHASADCKEFQESLYLQVYELSMGTYALTNPKGGQRTSENAIVRERGVSCSAKPSACREPDANVQ